jgi:hypothetical protein
VCQQAVVAQRADARLEVDEPDASGLGGGDARRTPHARAGLAEAAGR